MALRDRGQYYDPDDRSELHAAVYAHRWSTNSAAACTAPRPCNRQSTPERTSRPRSESPGFRVPCRSSRGSRESWSRAGAHWRHAGPALGQTTNDYSYSDTLIWVKGPDQLKLGGDLLRTQNFQPYYTNIRETFNFLGNWTSDPFADFLLGLLDSASRQTQPPQNYLFSTNFGLFAQDDFKISPAPDSESRPVLGRDRATKRQVRTLRRLRPSARKNHRRR